MRVLIVDARPSALAALANCVGAAARVDLCRGFVTARRRMSCHSYDRLVTNLRLRSYNGLHLVSLVPPATRCIVYTDREELFLAREVRCAGAFYEWFDRLPCVLPAYITSALPPIDRRNPACMERRSTYRGGRRASDRFEAAVDDRGSFRV